MVVAIEFVSMLVMEANQISINENLKIVKPEHVTNALKVGFRVCPSSCMLVWEGWIAIAL